MRWSRRKSAKPTAEPADVDGGDSAADGTALNPMYDDQTVEVIRRVLGSGGVGFDVGAHDGSILRHMIEASPTARHHAFEPLPHLAAELRTRFPSVEVHEVALSETDSTATFNHVVSNPYYSGLRERRYDRPDEEIKVIDVVTRRLDALVSSAVTPRLVKIDVEGGERGVLLGGLQVLARARPCIVFEHGLGAADYYGTTPDEIYGILTERIGLSVTLMANWLDRRPGLSRADFVDEYSSGRNYYFMAHAPS